MPSVSKGWSEPLDLLAYPCDVAYLQNSKTCKVAYYFCYYLGSMSYSLMQ